MEQDRRTFLRRAATVAWATPVVITLGAAGAHAQSCLPAGTGCGIFFEDPEEGPMCAASPVGGLLCCNSCVPVNGQCQCS